MRRIVMSMMMGTMLLGAAGRVLAQDNEIKTERQANGGSLTPKERRQVNRQQNRVSNQIYNKKHNGRRQ